MLDRRSPASDGPPDPWALIELARDVRPADYATSFARQATQLSGLSWPVAVCARWRPAVARRGRRRARVLDSTLADALAHYSTVG